MPVNNVDNNPYAALGLTLNQTTAAEENDSGALATEDFLALMTTQLQNQDPLKPMDSGDFLGQIAAFSTVSGIGDLNTSFNNFAATQQSNLALQGSSLVGRTVFVPSSIGVLSAEDGLKGQINVPEPVTDLKVQIYAESGELLRTIEMGGADGYTDFTWDGFNENGEAMTPGTYQFLASGTIDGDNTAFGTATLGKVESVLVGGGNQGLILNLAGIGAVPFSEALEIL